MVPGQCPLRRERRRHLLPVLLCVEEALLCARQVRRVCAQLLLLFQCVAAGQCPLRRQRRRRHIPPVLMCVEEALLRAR